MKDLTKGNPSKVILSFALPVLIGSIFNLAYNLADMRIIGSYLGDDALMAVGSVSTLNDLILGFLMGVANGFGVVTSQFFGRKENDRVRKNFALSLVLGVLTAALIMAGCLAGLDGILNILQVTENREAAKEYISVILTGLIFSVIYNSLAANLRAIGDAYTPLAFLIISAFLNVGLDILCVGHLGLGVKGAAIATVIALIIAMVLCLIYTLLRYSILRPRLKDFLPEAEYLKQLIPAGISMGLMSSLVNFGTVALQSAINSLGGNIIIAHAATRKLTSFFMMPFMSLATAMSTFAGQNYGAGRIDRIKQGLVRSLFFSYLWCLVDILMSYTICPYLIVAITSTDTQEVIDTACLYQRVDTLFYMIVPTISIIRNSLQGMGDHITPIVSSALELIGKLVFALIFTPIWKYWAIIWAEPVVWVIMVIPLILGMLKKLGMLGKSTGRTGRRPSGPPESV